MDLLDMWNMCLSENVCDIDTIIQNDKQIIKSKEHMPECGKLNISTKTKILYFNTRLDLEYLFWNLPLISYDDVDEGIIKKQMKFIFNEKEQVRLFEDKIKNINFPVETIILNQVDNPNGRVIFKDTRKVSVGMSSSCVLGGNKKKSAFYNCLVIIYRIKIDTYKFKEFHIKLFNSGKVEVPGTQSEEMIDVISRIINNLIQTNIEHEVKELTEKRETVLVNSNFDCGYCLNREILVKIIKKDNVMKCKYDPCNYPGIQCKYKLSGDKCMSVMIFRTGSVLIVGKCEDEGLYEIYNYIKKLLCDNFVNIYESNYIHKNKKNKKIIKKTICVSNK